MTQPSTPAFNLLDEPWLPVRAHSGEVREVGLATALLQAADYSALAETSPPNLVALYRLLLATLHRALTLHHGPWKDADRARWYREGLPADSIRAYLEQWRDRFWLFHPEHPFMQVPALADAERTKNKLKSWTQLALERSGGDTPLLFDQSLDVRPISVSYSVAVRYLVGYLQFTPGGLVKTFKDSDFAGPLASTAAILPVDHSLSETLTLNLHPFPRNALDDLPSWETSPPNVNEILDAPTLPTGHNDRYSRLTRSVLFVPTDKPGQISHLRFSEGLRIEEDHRDPMVCYRVVDGQPRRVSFSNGRSLWRDLPSMVPDNTGRYDIPATSLGWASILHETLGDFTANLTVLAAGWKNAPRKAAKLIRWRLDKIELPYDILQDPEKAGMLRMLVRDSEQLFNKVTGIGSGMIAATMPDPDHNDTKKKANAILASGPTASVFFSTCERALPGLMHRIVAGDGDATHAFWMQVLRTGALHAWEATGRVLGSSPRALRAEARAYPRFQRLLRTLEAAEDEQTATEATP